VRATNRLRPRAPAPDEDMDELRVEEPIHHEERATPTAPLPH
jgi:hypothetical protein